jgi:hypothetical protein
VERGRRFADVQRAIGAALHSCGLRCLRASRDAEAA